MGYYLNSPEIAPTEKAIQLVRKFNAKVCDCPEDLGMLLDTEALVCVVENGLYDAAALIYNNRELESWKYDLTHGNRRWYWLIMDKKIAHELADYEERT